MYNFDEEMENVEDSCCEECSYWGAFALKHGISIDQINSARKTHVS